MKTTSAIACLALLANLAVAQANPVDVSYTVSGIAGNWTFDFAVTDNLGGTNNLYLFGVELPARNIVGSPAGWDPNAVNGYNPSIYGGSNTNYNNIWITSPTGSSAISPGQTLSGFKAVSSDLTLPLGVKWMAVAAGGTYTGPGCSFICSAPHDNPGFEGTAVVTAVPVPAAAWLFGSGLGVMSWIRRKRAV